MFTKISKSSFKSYLKTLYSSSFIKKYLLSYVLITCLFFSFLIITTTANYTSRINDINSKSLIQASITNDTLFSNLYNFCYRNFTEDSGLISTMYAKEYTPDLSITAANILNRFMNYNNMIESVYIINNIQEVVFSTYTPLTPIAEFFDKDILNLLDDPNTPMYPTLYIPREVNFFIYNYTNYDQRLLTMIFRSSKDGALVININQDKFASMINTEIGDTSSQTIILNNRGQVISDTHNNYFTQDFMETDLYSLVVNRPEEAGIFNTSIDGEKFTINFRKQNNLGFTYITLTKHTFLDISNSHLTDVAPYIAFFIILTLILAFILSHLLYRPIGKLKNIVEQSRFTKDTLLPAHQNEFDYLSEAFTTINNKYHTLEKNASIYLRTKKDKALRSLLSSRDALSSFTLNDFESVNLHFESKIFLVLIVSIDCYHEVLIKEKSNIQLIKYSIINVAEELFENYYSYESLDMAQDKITFILNFDEYSKETLNQLLIKLQQAIFSYFDVSLSIGIGSLQEEIEDLSISYSHASTALLYRLVQNNGCRVYYKTLQLLPHTEQTYPYEIEKDIIASIKASQIESLISNIDLFFDILSTYAYNQIVLSILQLNHALVRIEYSYNISSTPDLVFEELSFYTVTFAQLKSLLITRCQNIINEQQEIKMNSSSKLSLIDHVVRFIQDNKFNGNLSVELIAQEVNLSVNYLRVIFKEHMGESLSNYITNNKINLICELLVETDLSIQEICDKLGFTTRNYFFTFFKKHLNMTPNQYRKIHTSSSEEDI